MLQTTLNKPLLWLILDIDNTLERPGQNNNMYILACHVMCN
ncbi:hypothetical protein CI610_03298 [invertebrate metagenome]|uniref:Uncharacterized protein n=1 Tax=invertebrate metagenome TaxID=1711999 RepID=A0A2H9T3J1_9ZZZZ